MSWPRDVKARLNECCFKLPSLRWLVMQQKLTDTWPMPNFLYNKHYSTFRESWSIRESSRIVRVQEKGIEDTILLRTYYVPSTVQDALCVTLLNSRENLVRYILLSPFYRWGRWGWAAFILITLKVSHKLFFSVCHSDAQLSFGPGLWSHPFSVARPQKLGSTLHPSPSLGEAYPPDWLCSSLSWRAARLKLLPRDSDISGNLQVNLFL